MLYPRIIAHRGGGALAPENTLAGLRLAARLGCRAVEFDVMLTADGVPVLMHDETLERTTDGSGSIAALSLAALRRFDAGAKRGAAFRGEVIPTLEETLGVCADLGLWANIEIKPGQGREEETGTVTGRLLARAWCGPGIVSSFSSVALAAARRVAPALDYALLVGAIPGDWRERLAAEGCQALHVDAARNGAPELAAVVAAGIPVACYTVNRRDDVERLFALGVAAVFTDRPDLWRPEDM